MTRALLVVVAFSLVLAACTQKVVCPAYQSAFIYDKEALRKKFSYFKEDSTPKVYTASRNKYLIGESVPYKKKERALQTVAMKPVNPVIPDSLQEGFEAEISDVERNVNDSTAVIRIDTLQTVQDSIYVISKDREVRVLKYDPMTRQYGVDTVGFNTEQDNYMWYLRDVLVLPDARLAKLKPSDKEEKSTSKKKADKAEKKGFFKNLFKKKPKKTEPQPDSIEQVKPEEEDYGYDEFHGRTKDSTQTQSTTQPDQVKPKKEKFSLFKKKKTEKKATQPPPAKKEEDDDGF